jgi:hypothetical protein
MRQAPAKPPAQPVGMTESKRKRTSWQKPACTQAGIFSGIATKRSSSADTARR